MRRRHADVDHGDVRAVAPHLQEQLVGAAGLSDDVEAGVGEDPGHPLAQEDRVLGEDYPHGIWARMRVPAPGWLSTSRTPSRASTRSTSPRNPEPRVGSAPPTPSSDTSTTARPFRRTTLISTAEASEYLATFASAS